MKRQKGGQFFLKKLFTLVIVFSTSQLSAQVPTITSFAPASGPIGTTVTITGTNFSTTTTDNIVWFGAVRATVNSATATSLGVTVPAGATYQPITVTVSGLTAYSDKPFITTLPGLRIIDATAFASKVDFTTGANPQGVVIGDIDGDGKPDIVVTNWGSDFVSVFRNNSTTGSITSGSFEPKVDFTVGGNSPFVAIGDIDGDGKTDMVVVSRTGNVVSVFRNSSTPGSITASSFESKVDFAAGDGPDCVAIGDIDSDGKPDLVVTNYNSNTVSVFRNTSTTGTITLGSFAPKLDLATGLQPYFVGLGDLDKDGKTDLVISNYNSYSISIYRNNSTSGSITSGSFDPRVDLISGSRPYGLAIGDLDGDNKPDVSIVSSDNAVVSVFRNLSSTGSITSYSFAPKVDFATGIAPSFVTLGDINGDGKPDLVVGNTGSGTISILKNNSLLGSIGPGSFSSRFDFAGGSSYGIAVGDIDCDGKQDIVVTNGINATVSVLHNEIVERMLPVIASFTPTSGPVGTAVTITGSNFNTTLANNIVWFGAVRATVTASTSTQLTVTVPAGATYKPFTVTVTGLTAYSSSPFNVTIPGTNTFDATSLAPKVDFATGNGTRSVAIADFDGDGKSDLVVSNYSTTTNSITVFRNASSLGIVSVGSFDTGVTFDTGSNPAGIAIADIDGDGKPDIVVANGNFSVSIFRNMCSPGSITAGSFSAKVDIMASTSPYDVAIGDLDGDGKPDLAVPNYMNNTVSVFRNNSEPGTISTGSFDPRVDFPVGSNPYRVAIGDIDGDGKPDLIVTNWSSNTVSILKNLSSAGSFTLSSFATKVDFTTGTNPGQIAIADIDGDGKQDVTIANQNSNSFSIFRNISTSGLLTTSSLAPRADFLMDISTGARALAVGDVDGDGKPDLVIGNSFPGNNKSYVFRNTSTSGTIATGSFAPRIEFIAGNEPSNIAIGDLDGDGKADIVVSTANSISLLRNKLSEPLPPPPPTISSFAPASGAVGSSVTLTGSGFSATLSDNIVWFGAVKATVTAATATQLTVTVPAGATYQPVSVTVNGLTGFSKAPFLVTFQSSRTINATSFATMVEFATGTVPWSVAVGDFDLDGKPDLVAVNSNSNSVSVIRNTSVSGSIISDSFASRVDFSTGSNPQHAAIGDLDGDGKPDLVVTNWGSNTVSVFRNISSSGSITSGSFAPKVDFPTGNAPFKVCIGDLDIDGKPDLVVTNYSDGTFSVLRNTSVPGSISTSSFETKFDFSSGVNPYFASIGDLDGDGKPDLAVANFNSSTVSVFRNSSIPGAFGLSSFAPKVDFFTSIGTICPVIGDIDGDSKPDMVVLNNHTNTVSVFRNISMPGSLNSGSFEPRVDFTSGNSPYSVAIADIEGDGKPDLVVAGGAVSIHRNTSISGSINTSSFATKVEINGGDSSFEIAVCDFDGDGRPDFALPNNTKNTISVFRNIIPEFVPVGLHITSFSPTFGQIGSTVTITGTGFSTTPANNTVWFGAVRAIVTSATSTSLTVAVQKGSTYQPISVTVEGLTAYSAKPFIVTFPGPHIIGANAFSAKVDFPTGTNPWGGSAIADLDCDGKPDLIVTNFSGNSISIFRNNSSSGTIGESSFDPRVDFPTGLQPYSVAVGDLDGDGKPDIVVTNANSNTISIFRNQSVAGNLNLNSLYPKIDLPIGMGPLGVQISDIDGDGKPDLAVTCPGNDKISIFRNNCSPGVITVNSFDQRVDFATGSWPGSIAIADIDGDDKPDIAVTNLNSNNISIFKNTATAGYIATSSLALKVDLTLGTNTRATVTIGIVIADFDSDNKPDLAVTNQETRSVSVFKNISSPGSITSGSFASKIDFASGMTPQSIVAGDIDGDGKPDLAITNNGAGTISVFKNTSTTGSINTGSFSEKIDFPTRSDLFSIAMGDLDGDSQPDLIVVNNSSHTLSVLRNKIADAIAPVISSFSPVSGSVGTVVTIVGSNFNTTPAYNAVSFGYVPAIVTSATATQLVVTVPEGAVTEPIIITVNGLTVASGTSFIVTSSSPEAPVINFFSPTFGPVGTTVTINGMNFSSTPADNNVTFGGIPATVSSASSTQLIVTVPGGSGNLPILVTVNGLTGSSNTPFTVTSGEVNPSINSFAFESSVITLNGDGINDRLVIQNFEIYGKCDISIYNSRGLLIFSQKDYQNDWDMTINGRQLVTGGYFYVAQTDKGVFRGSFSILTQF